MRKWINIHEGVPEKGRKIMFTNNKGKICEGEYINFEYLGGHFAIYPISNHGFSYMPNVTQWQYIDEQCTNE